MLRSGATGRPCPDRDDARAATSATRAHDSDSDHIGMVQAYEIVMGDRLHARRPDAEELARQLEYGRLETEEAVTSEPNPTDSGRGGG